jgi:hypothetical protein
LRLFQTAFAKIGAKFHLARPQVALPLPGIRNACFLPADLTMEPTHANQEPNSITNSQSATQFTTQDKSSIFRPKTEDECLAVSVAAPMRMPQHYRQRQQHYTGDA